MLENLRPKKRQLWRRLALAGAIAFSPTNFSQADAKGNAADKEIELPQINTKEEDEIENGVKTISKILERIRTSNTLIKDIKNSDVLELLSALIFDKIQKEGSSHLLPTIKMSITETSVKNLVTKDLVETAIMEVKKIDEEQN